MSIASECSLALVVGPQGTPLYSVDGSVFIELRGDGTFGLFAAETGSIIFEFVGPTGNTNLPLSVIMQTVCPCLPSGLAPTLPSV